MRVIIVYTFVYLSAINVLMSQNIPNSDSDYLNNLNTITSAVPFLTITPDARAGAMGEVGAATIADIHSLHWNNAKSAFLNKSFVAFTARDRTSSFLSIQYLFSIPVLLRIASESHSA